MKINYRIISYLVYFIKIVVEIFFLRVADKTRYKIVI